MLGGAAPTAAATSAHAQVNDPSVYTSTSYSSGYRGAMGSDAVYYQPVWVNANGGSHLRLNTVSLGIQRNSATALPVDLEVTVREMTFNPTTYTYGIGNVVATGTASLDASTSINVTTLTWTWGATDPSTRPVVNLETVSNGANGWAGLWVGLGFKGANAADSTNGWRCTNEPSVGRSFNRFGIYTISTAGFAYAYYFGTTTGTDGVVRENNARFAIDVARARADVAAFAAALRSPADEPDQPLHYAREATGYAIVVRGVRAAEIPHDGAWVRGTPGVDAATLREAVSGLSMRMLALAGLFVVHASAVRRPDGAAWLFSGASGAGKTTTARAFAAAGCTLVGEDTLAIAVGDGPPRLLVDAEPALRRFREDAASALIARPDEPASAAALLACSDGASCPIAQIGYLAADRRDGLELRAAPLPGAEATATLLANSFFGDDTDEGWRRAFHAAAAIVRRVRSLRLTAPAGVDALRRAAHGSM